MFYYKNVTINPSSKRKALAWMLFDLSSHCQKVRRDAWSLDIITTLLRSTCKFSYLGKFVIHSKIE